MSVFYDTQNSTYEVDGDRVRRLSGVNAPTDRFGQDEVWRVHQGVQLFGPVGRRQLWIHWETTRYTVTSFVTAVRSSEPGVAVAHGATVEELSGPHNS